VIETTESVDRFKAVGESLETFVLCVVARRIVAVVGEDLLTTPVGEWKSKDKVSKYLVLQSVANQHLMKLSCEPVTCVGLREQKDEIRLAGCE
jgi:hypothetical protein